MSIERSRLASAGIVCRIASGEQAHASGPRHNQTPESRDECIFGVILFKLGNCLLRPCTIRDSLSSEHGIYQDPLNQRHQRGDDDVVVTAPMCA